MLTRRRFARSGGALLLPLACPVLPLFAQAAPPKRHAGAPEFSVMLWTLKQRGSFDESLARVASAGYKHVELVDEFKHWTDEDQRRITQRMGALGLSVDAMAGLTLGFADPAGTDAFLGELKRLLPVAQRLGCRQIILLSGKRIVEMPAERQHAAAVETLRRASVLLKAAGLVGVIEPIDRLENPGIYLDGVTEAFEIARAVGSANVKVLYDLYHEQRGQGNLIEKIEKNADAIGLVHVADAPGRHEPGTGEVNYRNVYRGLARSGYGGVIAMEFYPTGDVVQALRQAREEATRAWSEA